jgi:hypothetical protein
MTHVEMDDVTYIYSIYENHEDHHLLLQRCEAQISFPANGFHTYLDVFPLDWEIKFQNKTRHIKL